MNKFKHLMLDIETMGNESYSAITAVAAVEFNIETGELGESFHEKIDLKSSVDIGLNINPSTVLWWLKQDKPSQNYITEEVGEPIDKVLSRFKDFCNKDYQIWGNSARFDCGILQNAYNKLNIPIPWDFRKERCLRTLVSFKPEIKNECTFKGIRHNPLDDCKFQINYCHQIWKTLNN